MNSTDILSGVERVNVGESRRNYDPDGRRYWTRTVVCHGGGTTRTIVLHADSEGALQLQFHPQDLDACLAGLSAAQLDDLIASAKTERMSRDADGHQCQFPLCAELATAGDFCPEHSRAEPGPMLVRPMSADLLPRDCDGDLATESPELVAAREKYLAAQDGLPF